jgi:hypothetical protein
MVDAAAIEQRGGQRDVRAHREADQMRPLDTGMVHQGEHVARHRLAGVFLRFVRLGALAMAAIVYRQAAHALGGDGVVPAHALPVLVLVGRKAVHQDDRLARVLGSEFVVSERPPVGCELSHDFP